MKKIYEIPEIVELGQVATLTQGAKGCVGDGSSCEEFNEAHPF